MKINSLILSHFFLVDYGSENSLSSSSLGKLFILSCQSYILWYSCENHMTYVIQALSNFSSSHYDSLLKQKYI
jgi:hypothetical protein